MLLAFGSLLQDWGMVDYGFYEKNLTLKPIFNVRFLTAILFIAAFSFIFHLNTNKKYKPTIVGDTGLMQLMKYIIAGILLFVTYMSLQLEISEYFDQLYAATSTKESGQYHPPNSNIRFFKTVWLAIYSFVFLTVLSFLNIKIWKNKELGQINLGLNTFVGIFLLAAGLFVISQLRDNYLDQKLAEYYHVGSFNIVIRYIFLAVFAGFMYAFYQAVRQDWIKDLHPKFEILMHE